MILWWGFVPSPGMDGELSVVEAADYVGVSERGLRDIIKRGELESLALAGVQALHQARRVDALRALERRRRSPVDLAREVRDRLHPRHLPNSNLPGEAERAQRFRLSVLRGDHSMGGISTEISLDGVRVTHRLWNLRPDCGCARERMAG